MTQTEAASRIGLNQTCLSAQNNKRYHKYILPGSEFDMHLYQQDISNTHEEYHQAHLLYWIMMDLFPTEFALSKYLAKLAGNKPHDWASYMSKELFKHHVPPRLSITDKTKSFIYYTSAIAFIANKHKIINVNDYIY